MIQLLLLVPLLPHLVESDQNVEQRDQESRLSEDLILYYNVTDQNVEQRDQESGLSEDLILYYNVNE